jgi:DNA replication protein DnaC
VEHYARPDVLIIDEVGYLSYANRHADLLFDVINRRYELKPTIVTTFGPARCRGIIILRGEERQEDFAR